MKNYFLLFLLSLTSYLSLAQEFLGIKVDGKKDAAINAFKSKGFRVDSDINKDVVTMIGNAGGKNFEINIVCSPKSKTVWKFSVYLPAQISWESLRSDYYEYLKILTDKYGEPKSKFSFFSSPYEEGDGYEMIGVGVEKCTYSAYWSDQIGISIKITKYKQVNIRYENAVNSAIDDKEKAELNKTIF